VVKIADWVFFARPMLLIPVWTVYLHYLSQCDSRTHLVLYPARTAVLHLGILTLIFAGTYILNQIFDIESDRINDKLFFLPRKIISLPTAWILFIIITAAGIIMAASMQLRTLPAVLMVVLLGVLYSAPLVRLKDRPLLIPWMASWNCPERAVGTIAIPYFFAIAAGYVLTTIPDLDGDAATGKRTIAVILKAHGALWVALAFTLAAGGTSIWTGNIELAVTAAVTGIMCVYLLFSYRQNVVMLACKLPILLLTVFATIHYPLYGAILLLTYFLTRAYYKKRFRIVYPRPN